MEDSTQHGTAREVEGRIRHLPIRGLLIGVLVLQIAILALLAVLLMGGSFRHREHAQVSGSAPEPTMPEPQSGESATSPSSLDLTANDHPSLHDELLENFLRHRPARLDRQMDRMLQRVAQEFDQIDSFMDFDEGWGSLVTSPSMDMRDDGDSYVVRFSLPGVREPDIQVHLDNRLLTVRAESRVRHPGKQSSTSRFEQRVWLPGPVADADPLQTSMTNGILRVTVRKSTALSPGAASAAIPSEDPGTY